jgi:glycogen(starch) synthase
VLAAQGSIADPGLSSRRVDVLAVGNMYPPHHLGGYELLWHSATHHLRRLGHRVRIVTSDFRADLPDADIQEDPDIRRELRWYWSDHGFPRMSLRERLRLEHHNAEVLASEIAAVDPDVVAWWGMGGMSLSLVESVRRRGLPAVGMVVDDWLVYGPRVDGWQRALGGRRVLANLTERATGIPLRLDLGGSALWLFVSETVRRRAAASGMRLHDSDIAHAGIDGDLFRPAPERPWRGRLLYVGRIDRRKGIETAVRAVAALPDVELEVVGAGDDAFQAELFELIERERLGERVTFRRKPRTELPATYADADAVLFPTLWEEPWGLVPLEAMAVGRPVVATGTGGSAEFLRHEENCLIFRPSDDPGALAAAIRRLAGDESLRRRLREGGFETARTYTVERFDERVAAAITERAGAA